MEHNKLKRTVPAGKKPVLKLTRTLVAKIRGVNHATDVVTAMLFANAYLTMIRVQGVCVTGMIKKET
jgi:hypothetical protein